jgi:hypothetical protein
MIILMRETLKAVRDMKGVVLYLNEEEEEVG